MMLMTLAVVLGLIFVGLSFGVIYSCLGVLLAPVVAAIERPDPDAERQIREIEQELRDTKRLLRQCKQEGRGGRRPRLP